MDAGRARMVGMGVLLVVVAAGVPGCLTTQQDARYVYQDGDFGVIGVPRNTSFGKKDYRQQAHQLMTLHFPEGYEIVRAEEIVAGERVTDTARKVEVDSEPGINALNQMLKVGKFAKSTSLDQKDTLQITESRIIYRRKSAPGTTLAEGFTRDPHAAPDLYIDPNRTTRDLAAATLLAARKKAENPDPAAPKAEIAAKPAPADPAVQKVATAAPAATGK